MRSEDVDWLKICDQCRVGVIDVRVEIGFLELGLRQMHLVVKVE